VFELVELVLVELFVVFEALAFAAIVDLASFSAFFASSFESFSLTAGFNA
jgi:hypothetical protein